MSTANRPNTPEIVNLALDIADETAVSDIECYCRKEDHSGIYFGEWYDVTDVDEYSEHIVNRADAYLTLRKKLIRHPSNSNLVRPLAPRVAGKQSLAQYGRKA